MMVAARILFGLLFILLFTAERADACSCGGGGSPCQEFGRASAVFVGTVTEMTMLKRPPMSVEEARRREDSGEYLGSPRVFKFVVEQAFSGVNGMEVEVSTGMGGGDCGYEFKIGMSYLVYAYHYDKSGRLITSICTRTKPVAEMADDLEFLRGLPTRAAGVTISGVVVRQRRRVRDDSLRPTWGLADASLVVEGEGVTRELRTNSQGRYSLSGLKPGTYKVRLLLPDELTTYKPEQEVRVADRGCASVDYYVSDNGRISGILLDAEGKTAARVLLRLFEADDPDPLNHGLFARTDDEGRYSFSGVAPGSYLLAVNLTRFPEYGDPTHAFQRTYYPGVPQSSEAEVITLGEGQSMTARDMRLTPRRAESTAEIIVVWEDGRPVPNANVSFRDVTYHDPGMNYGEKADERGRFTLKGFEGQTFAVEARSNRAFVGDPRRDGPMERIAPLRVTLANPPGSFKIVITKLR